MKTFIIAALFATTIYAAETPEYDIKSLNMGSDEEALNDFSAVINLFRTDKNEEEIM